MAVATLRGIRRGLRSRGSPSTRLGLAASPRPRHASPPASLATLGRQPLIDHDNLEEFADPLDYDRKDSSDTGVAFYASLARETGDPVLELACGTGRVAIPIARQGFAVKIGRAHV